MATIAKELHDVLGTLIEQLSMMVADLQKIDVEQWDCLYKLHVMASISRHKAATNAAAHTVARDHQPRATAT
jgi:hypothetical protein